MYFGGPNSLMKMEHTKAKEEEKMSNERHQTETWAEVACTFVCLFVMKLHTQSFGNVFEDKITP